MFFVFHALWIDIEKAAPMRGRLNQIPCVAKQQHSNSICTMIIRDDIEGRVARTQHRVCRCINLAHRQLRRALSPFDRRMLRIGNMRSPSRRPRAWTRGTLGHVVGMICGEIMWLGLSRGPSRSIRAS